MLRRAGVVAQLILAALILVGLFSPEVARAEPVTACSYDVPGPATSLAAADRAGTAPEQAVLDIATHRAGRARGYDDRLPVARASAHKDSSRGRPGQAT
jgi:hypothetical protein